MIFSVILLGWSVFPVKVSSLQFSIPISSSDILSAPETTAEAMLVWPARIQTGRQNEILIQISFWDNFLPPEDEEYRQIEARLELPDTDFFPTGSIRQTIDFSHPLRLRWLVQPSQPGIYKGLIWLHVLEVSHSPNLSETRRLLSIQPVEIQAESLFGLPKDFAQAAGLCGVILAVFLNLDLARHLLKGNQ